jgi:transcriptional regulator with XRE-family HTH domain
MNLKRQLKLYLDQKELSATQLSKKSGISKQVLSLWMSGGSPRNIEHVKKVAEVLGTNVDHLCFGDGIETKQTHFNAITEDEWFSGQFEIKIRKIKGRE